jgi:hypothetical protein
MNALRRKWWGLLLSILESPVRQIGKAAYEIGATPLILPINIRICSIEIAWSYVPGL